MGIQVYYKLEDLKAAVGEDRIIRKEIGRWYTGPYEDGGMPLFPYDDFYYKIDEGVFWLTPRGNKVFMGRVGYEYIVFDNKNINVAARKILEYYGVPYDRW